MAEHRHYCTYRRHLVPCEAQRHCYLEREIVCEDCRKQAVAVASTIVPVVCAVCGVAKQRGNGTNAFVAVAWLRGGARMVCPSCHESEQAMDALRQVTGSWEDDDDIPF